MPPAVAKELETLKKQLREKDETIRKLRKDVEGAAKDVTDYETELNEFRRQLEADREKLDQELQQVRAQNEELEQAIREAEIELSKERAAIARERAQLQRLRNEIELEQQRSARNAGMTEKLAAVEELKREIQGGRASGSTAPPLKTEDLAWVTLPLAYASGSDECLWNKETLSLLVKERVARFSRRSRSLVRGQGVLYAALHSNLTPLFSVRSLLPHLREDGEVQEVHGAEHEQDDSDLHAQILEGLLDGGGLVAELQEQADAADVDQVEPDQQQVIDGVRQGFVACEGIDQEHPAVFVQRVADPYRQGHADRQIDNVGPHHNAHRSLLSCRSRSLPPRQLQAEC